MSIEGLDQDQFQELLRTYLTPARPISDPTYLRGRDIALRQIGRAFNSPGKHIFIFGDRGVGKTSLAQSAAVLQQSADNSPIVVACENAAGFFDLARDIAKRCLPTRELIEKRRLTENLKLSLFGLGYDVAKNIEHGIIPEMKTINDAALILKFVAQYHSKEPIIIIDEFDQLRGEDNKKYFADLIKQVSDQDINVRFIFCGIGTSLDELIGLHLSTDRYLLPVELETLSHDALWEILNAAARALDIEIGREEQIRIGLISDGFPYYVHLVGEIMFWSAFDDKDIVKTIQLKHFDDGIRGAISEAMGSLRLAYAKATEKYSDDYQEVLWSVADGKTLNRRQVSEIYQNSYVPIMMKRTDRECLDKQKFYSRMNNLKTERHGKILLGTSAGWYQFRDNITRGYVRLRAESAGIQLGVDHHFGKQRQQIS